MSELFLFSESWVPGMERVAQRTRCEGGLGRMETEKTPLDFVFSLLRSLLRTILRDWQVWLPNFRVKQ